MTQTCTVPGCGQARPGHQWICRTCVAQLERALTSVPALWRELDVTLTRQDVIGSDSGSRSAETALAFKETASEARWALANTIGTWARVLAENAGAPTPEKPAQWLLANVQSLAMHEAVAEAVDEIGDAVAQAYRVIDRPPEFVLAGVCGAVLRMPDPNAELLEDRVELRCFAPLYARPGHMRTKCEACGNMREVAERRDEMVENAAEYLVTGTIALGWVRMLMGKTIPDGTWRSWCSRGRVVPHGTNHLGQPTYRFGDVRDLALGWVTKTRRAA